MLLTLFKLPQSADSIHINRDKVNFPNQLVYTLAFPSIIEFLFRIYQRILKNVFEHSRWLRSVSHIRHVLRLISIKIKIKY